MAHYYDLTITLDHIRPPLWRRILLADDATLLDLHRAIQDACGWEHYHLFEFSSTTGERLAGVPDEEDETLVRHAATVPLSAVVDAERATLRYVYDFGDTWQHTVRCEGVVKSDERFHRRLLGGARAFPPEDCGGLGGYAQCVDVARGGEDEEDLREWLGDWDPDRFDLQAARGAFDVAVRPPGPASPFLRPDFPSPVDVDLLEGHTPPREELAAAAERVQLLPRLQLFAQWVGTGRKLTGTGNLTMAAGRELIGLLGTEDRLDKRIGDRVFKTKSTAELPEVDFAFRLAQQAGFVKVRKGTVSATKRGTQLGRDPFADWLAACRGLLNLGVLRHRYAHATWIDPYWKEVVDEQIPGLLAHLFAVGRPVPLVELQERLWQLVDASFILDDLDRAGLQRHRDMLDRDVRRICRVLAGLGAVEVTDVETIRDVHGYEQEHGGWVALTPLGAAAVRELAGQR